jgi:hypothetical protein
MENQQTQVKRPKLNGGLWKQSNKIARSRAVIGRERECMNAHENSLFSFLNKRSRDKKGGCIN